MLRDLHLSVNYKPVSNSARNGPRRASGRGPCITARDSFVPARIKSDLNVGRTEVVIREASSLCSPTPISGRTQAPLAHLSRKGPGTCARLKFRAFQQNRERQPVLTPHTAETASGKDQSRFPSKKLHSVLRVRQVVLPAFDLYKPKKPLDNLYVRMVNGITTVRGRRINGVRLKI